MVRRLKPVTFYAVMAMFLVRRNRPITVSLRRGGTADAIVVNSTRKTLTEGSAFCVSRPFCKTKSTHFKEKPRPKWERFLEPIIFDSATNPLWGKVAWAQIPRDETESKARRTAWGKGPCMDPNELPQSHIPTSGSWKLNLRMQIFSPSENILGRIRNFPPPP